MMVTRWPILLEAINCADKDTTIAKYEAPVRKVKVSVIDNMNKMRSFPGK